MSQTMLLHVLLYNIIVWLVDAMLHFVLVLFCVSFKGCEDDETLPSAAQKLMTQLIKVIK